ncbi:MAG TPA: tetratricopeptide repeat protein, partial [bacterium]|nr:tetratricopeptide repeat protein [bacterium]
MNRNRFMTGLMILLLITVVSFSGSCQKMNISTLKANYYFNQANHSFTENEYRQAIEQYEKALQHNPRLVQAYRYLGESYKQMYRPGDQSEANVEREQKALEALNKAHEIDPNDKNIIHSLADMYNRMQNFDEAEKFYLKILEMEPTNLSNYYVVAEFYKSYAGLSEEKEGQEGEVTEKTPFQKAEEMYLRRIETDPDNPQGLSYIAQFYGNMSPI